MAALEQEALKRAQPFAALLGVSSLLLGLLYVGGYSYRWAYFYNFGAQHLVARQSVQSVVTTAFELVRIGPHLLITATCVVAPLVAFHAAGFALHRVAASPSRVGRIVAQAGEALGLRSTLVLDLLRTTIIVIGTFQAGYRVGYRAFQAHVVESAENPLPRVTVLLGGRGAEAIRAVRCGADPEEAAGGALIGGSIETLRSAHRTCSHANAVWRLLYRDDDSIYVFAAEALPRSAVRRPLTMVLPNAKDAVLVLD